MTSTHTTALDGEKHVSKRTRANRTACATCHQRKVRCDAQNVGFPCTNCRKHFRSDCAWHQKRRRPLARSPHHFVPIRQAIHEHNVSASPEPILATEAVQQSPMSIMGDSADAPDPSDEVESQPRGSLVGDGVQGCRKHLVEFIDQDDLNHRPIDKGARIAYVGTDVSNINFLIRQSDERILVHHFPTNRLDRRYTAYEPDRLPVEAFQLPEKQIVDDLLQAYFEKINPGFPVVEEVRFMAQYRARDASDPPSLLLLQAVLLVGAHACPAHNSLKSDFFRRAKILIDSRFERNRDVIVQAALLLTWYSDGLEDVAANAWYWIGFAARTAIGLGMHRDAEPSNLVEHNKRMWKRVWWLLVQCDLLISLQYGRPLAINLEDTDVRPPQSSDYDGCGPNTQVDYAIATTELCIMLCSIYRRTFGPRVSSASRKASIIEADERLARWSLMLPHNLRLRPTLTLDLWPAILHLFYNTILILLHRPRRPMQSPGSPSGTLNQNDAEICSAAASVIQSIFESLCERQHLSSLWTFSVTALFTAMIQLSVEVRFARPLLAIAAVRRYDSTLYSLRHLAGCWPHAESILHFFEHSDRLQRLNLHVELPKESPSALLASPESHRRTRDDDLVTSSTFVTTSTSPNDVFGGPLRLPTVTTPLDLRELVPDENASTSGADVAKNWRQLFPFTDTFEAEGLPGAAFAENWKEAYWQEPFDLGPEFDFS